MKSRKLKNWVVNFILVIQFILIMLMSADCEILTNYVIIHAICLLLFIGNTMILSKYSDLFNEE